MEPPNPIEELEQSLQKLRATVAEIQRIIQEIEQAKSILQLNRLTNSAKLPIRATLA